MVASCVTDRFNAEELKSVLVDKGVKRFYRTRSKVVQKFGYRFRSEISVEEASKCIMTDQKTPLHSDKDLADFMASVMNSTIPLDTPQYRLWLIEDFTPDSSVCVALSINVLDR